MVDAPGYQNLPLQKLFQQNNGLVISFLLIVGEMSEK